MNSCCSWPVEKIASNNHLRDGECCLVTEKTSAPPLANCPVSQTRSRKVQMRTVRCLVREDGHARLKEVQYYFCEEPTCPVVYFSNEDVPPFSSHDLKVKVFSKDTSGDVPVCYCFAWTRDRIRSEISETGRSTAAADIARFVKAGMCECDLKNPKGRCCLGDVDTVAKEAMRDQQQGTQKAGRQ